jgi:hemerythrin-like metal-binding protein
MPQVRAWDEGIGTGVDSMDTEHRLQVSLVNALEEALRSGPDAALASRTLQQLVDFTSVHFHSEELMMRLYSYPQLENHSAAHAKLMEQVQSIRDEQRANDPAEAMELVRELRGWLVNHIKSMDQAFALWLARKGYRAQ